MSNDLPDRRTPPGSDEEERPSRKEVESALRDRSEAISRHASALQREMGESGQSLLGFVSRRPWLSLGGAVAVGLGISWLWGRGRRKRRASESTHRLLTELYMDALADDVDYQVRQGKEPEEAVYAALQDRVPLIFHEERKPASKQSRGTLKLATDLLLKTTMGFVIKSGLDYVTNQVGLEEVMGEQHDGHDVATVAAAASEEPS